MTQTREEIQAEIAALDSLLPIDWRLIQYQRREAEVARLEHDLSELPPLREWIHTIYIHGGWHKYAKRPPEVEVSREADGVNPKGETVYRRRCRNLELQSGRDQDNNLILVPVEQASRESTMAIIREMKRVGWGSAVAQSYMGRHEAVGASWLAAQADPDREFHRCWEKASVPVSELAKRKPQEAKSHKGFVSHVSDQKKVLAFIEENPGLGLRELRRVKGGLDGQHTNGRIDAALAVLVDEGRVVRTPGSNRKVHHHAVAGMGFSSPLSEDLRYGTPEMSEGVKRWLAVRDGVPMPSDPGLCWD